MIAPSLLLYAFTEDIQSQLAEGRRGEGEIRKFKVSKEGEQEAKHVCQEVHITSMTSLM